VAALLEAGGMLVLVLAFLVASGSAYVYREAFSRAIIALANGLDAVAINAWRVHVRPLAKLAAWLRWLDSSIEGLLGLAVQQTERGIVLLWNGLAWQVRALAKLLGDLAETIEHRFHHLLLAFPPAALLWAAVRAAQALPGLYSRVARVEHVALARLASSEATLDRWAHAEADRLARGIDRVRARVEHELARDTAKVRAGIAGLEHELAGELSRVRRLDRILAAAGAAALVGTALGRLGLGWLRCPRVTKTGKRLCGLDPDLLEALLAATLVVGSSISVVALARECRAFTADVDGALRLFVRELHAISPAPAPKTAAALARYTAGDY
jgi:hypothetical protein